MQLSLNDHLCGVDTGKGQCANRLDKYHVRCERHAVFVERVSGKQEFCSCVDVKVGDKVAEYR